VTDLFEFLRARLDEDQAEAEKQRDGQEWDIDPWQIRYNEVETNYAAYIYLRIAKARVLREVEAKRRILGDELDRALDAGRTQRDLERSALVRLLALPYADHPDFRQEWAP
jgi:hypothetical protein